MTTTIRHKTLNVNAEIITPRVYKRSGGRLHSNLRPIVLEHRSRRKRSTRVGTRERYSDSLEDIQRAERHLVRAARRATRAAAEGVDTYDRERRLSARSKKDGAIEDFPHNYASAVSETIREASDIPMDVAKALAPRKYRKRVRRNLRRVSGTMRVFRL